MNSVDRPASSPLEETLDVFDQLDDRSTPLAAEEVAERLGYTHERAVEALDDLVERGALKARTVGDEHRVWWRPTDSRRAAEDGPEAAESATLGAFVRAVEEYAIFTLDPEGRVTSWNEGARRIKGYEREEILGEHVSVFYTAEDRERSLPERNLERAAERGRVEDEGWRVRADGSEFRANVVLTAIRDDDGTLLGFAKVTRDMTDQREQERDREQTREILRTSPVAISVRDSSGETVLANHRARELLGLSEDEIVGDVADIDEWGVYDANGDPLDREETPSARVLRTGDPVYDETIAIEPPGGERLWLSVSAAPVFGPDGELERVVTAGENVTRLKTHARRVERQRDEIEHRLAEVFGRVTDAFYGLDDEGRITHANARAEEVFGRPEREVVGEDVWEAFPEMEEILDRETLRESMESGEPTTDERYFESGSAWFEVRIYPSETGVSVYLTDVTDRKRAEEALARSEKRLRLALDAGGIGVWELDLESGDSPTRSARHDRIFGYDEPVEEWGLERFLDHVHPADRARVEESFEAALEAGDWTFECRIRRPDGERRWIEAHGEFSCEDGEPARAVGVVRDITDRKEYERELERYRRIVETIDDGIYVADDEDRFTMVNQAYAEMTGYSREELLGAPTSMVVEPETTEAAGRIQRELADGERRTARLEADVHTADGGTFRAEATLAVLPSDDSRHERIGVVRDVADRVERERELEMRVRQQQVVTELGRRALEDPDLDELFDDAVEAVADTLDNDYCKVLELLPEGEELLLRSGCGWKGGYVGEATVGTEVESQAGYTLASREPVVVDDLATEERFQGPDLLVEHGVTSGISTIIGPFHDPWGILGTHDTAYREFSRHDVNFVQAVANILTNAIERNQYERRLTDTIEELKESNDRLEQFAYIASHDLQEPLRMVSNYLQLLEDRYRDELDDDAEEFIDFAVEGADRMREMIDDLLTYSRIERHGDPLEPVDAESVVDRVLENLQFRTEEVDAEIAVGSLPTVVGDERLLEQLFQNLVSNALKYRGEGPPHIEIDAARHGDGKWLFRVADDGIGIEPEYTDRIFEVFKRLHTHREYPGTGIGLTLCKRIADRHDGEIWVESTPGEGSTFYVTLPAVEGGA
jgi:PAS domain S-box-containing protein